MTNSIIASDVKIKEERNSAIELLRLIAMVLIVFAHFSTHGEHLYGEAALTPQRIWWGLAQTGGNLGTDVYVLISGYFLVTDDGSLFNIKRILKFWGQVFFYSLVMFLVFNVALGAGELSLKTFIKSFLPITFSRWWFASTYFLLYIIHPFLNRLLLKIDKSAYQMMLAIMILCWSIIPTFTTSENQSNPLIWFICLYCISGYIRLYGLNEKFECRHYFGLWVIITLITYMSSVTLLALGERWPIFSEHSTYLYERQTIFSLLRSIGLFMTFVCMKMKYHKWINVIASATFGVYLIHENGGFKDFVWGHVFNDLSFNSTTGLIAYSIAATAVVYILCTLIDLGRKYTIEKIFTAFVNRFAEKLMTPVKKIYSAIVGVIER